MFQLYKRRTFNDLFGDTFGFLRVHGKNYFGNYIKIAGGPVAILVVLLYLTFNVFFESAFSGNSLSDNEAISHFTGNGGLHIISVVLIVALALLLTMITYAFPVVYLKILGGGQTPGTGSLLQGIKGSVWQIIKFILYSFISFLPLLVLVGMLSFFLIAILIGIPVALMLLCFMICWYMQTFYDYLTSRTGFFNAMGNGYNYVSSKFWAHVGATAIFIIMVYIINIAASLIPYVIGGVFTMADVDTVQDQDAALSLLGIFALIAFIFSTILAYLLSNITTINQGMIYYSCLDNDKNVSLQSEIDLIGTDIE